MEKHTAEDLLISKGVKPTPQRVVIADYLLNTCCHPTAEQILDAVSDALPVSLSRATVYNTLNALVAAGAIQEVYTEPGGPARYDANISEHHHFVDVKTGNVFDIDGDMVPRITGKLGKKFKIKNYQITFFGEVTE